MKTGEVVAMAILTLSAGALGWSIGYGSTPDMKMYTESNLRYNKLQQELIDTIRDTDWCDAKERWRLANGE